jgi:nucleotidyltransferase/DNA polymerase involved in DNA repair
MTQFEIEIRPEDISKFMEKLPVQKLWGIGAKSAEKFWRLGIQTCSTTSSSNFLGKRMRSAGLARLLQKRAHSHPSCQL